MKVDKDQAMKLWKDVFGNETWVLDCFGTWIHRDDYGEYEKTRIRPNGTGKAYNYGWDIDHIRPKSSYENENDANFFNNFEPMHRSNNLAKSDNYPHFKISDKKYKVVTCSICSSHGVKGYGIIDESSNKRVDWKGKQNRYYK